MKTMKSVAIAVLAFAAISFGNAEDDGQYRPGKYGGDDGSYRPNDEGRYSGSYKVFTPLDNAYKSLIARNGKYESIYSTVQPFYVKAYNPYQQLLTPYVNYGAESGFDQDPFASSLAAVTYRPPVVPVVSTVAPFVYAASTPKPVVFAASAPKPVVYAASTARPVVYAASTPKPIVYAPSITALPVPSYAKSYGYPNEQFARIVKQDQDVDTNAYRYSYETENGIAAAETGVVDSNVGGGTRASGFYEYVGDDGLKYRVDYTADENGFHPSGAHLP